MSTLIGFVMGMNAGAGFAPAIILVVMICSARGGISFPYYLFASISAYAIIGMCGSYFLWYRYAHLASAVVSDKYLAHWIAGFVFYPALLITTLILLKKENS